MIDLFTYFWLFLNASLFSTSGLGNLPSLHADLIPLGWASERQFAEALTVGQVSPGPSGLWAISLGYLTAGLAGALLSTVALCIPPFAVLLVDQLHLRIGDHPAVRGFVRGLGLTVNGIFVIVMLDLLLSEGLGPRTLLIAAGAVFLALSRRVPVVVILLLGAVVGVVTG
jgi:chromate transporter